MTIEVPLKGRPAEAPGIEALEGTDGNAFAVIGTTKRLLQRAGASPEFAAAFVREATVGDYEHLLQAAIAYLEAEADQ